MHIIQFTLLINLYNFFFMHSECIFNFSFGNFLVWSYTKLGKKFSMIDYIDKQKSDIFNWLVGYCKLLSFYLLYLSLFQIFRANLLYKMQGHNPLSLSSWKLNFLQIDRLILCSLPMYKCTTLLYKFDPGKIK